MRATFKSRSTPLTDCLRRRIAGAIRHFCKDRSASIAMQFSLMIIPIIGLAGGAIDLANIMRLRNILQNAADAASVASVGVTSPAALAAQSMTGNGTIAVGQTDANNVFYSNIGSASNYASLTFTPSVTKSGLAIASTISFSATIQTSFMPIIGISSWTVQGSSYATGNLAPYVDFYLLLDNTPSMGIGATQADIDTMVANTPDQCAFACHEMDTAPNDYYGLAKSLGVTKRIDVVATATQDLMTTATQSEEMAGEFRAAIYTFGATAQTAGLTQVAQLSSSLSTVKTQAGNVDVMSVPYQNYNNDMQTDFDGVLSGVNALIPTPGDGSSASTPQKVLFFVSDGVADAYYPSTCLESGVGSGRCQEPMNVANCTAIKNRGIKIAVLYTTYYPLTTNAWYNSTVAPWASQIPTNMQACASPGLYFQVSPSQGISQAMSALFLQTVRTVRMTQ